MHASGAYRGASSATYTFLGVCGEGVVIAAVVDLFRLKQEHIGRARYHTKVAALASLALDGYRSVNFCHIFSRFRGDLRNIPAQNRTSQWQK